MRSEGWFNMTSEQTLGPMNPSLADAVVFVCLECLGMLAMVGNSILLCVIIKCRYCEKPSFVLISSLAVADILHGVVTTTFFYPPIILKMNHFSETAYRLMNVVDWTAWGITISHMTAICIDRLMAIVLLHRYTTDMTVKRARTFVSSTWLFFLTLNSALFFIKVCCPVVPVHEAYTFDYLVSPVGNITEFDYLTRHNVYPYIYIPLEVATLAILAFSNPFTVYRLYGRYKRKRDVRRASTVLMRTITTIGNMDNQGRIGRENFLNKDIKIFMQITLVTIIFFCYIFVYYIFFYMINIDNKWLSMFNSFFYSTTHMINPVVYFSLNVEMQRQLRSMFPCLFKSEPTHKESIMEATPLLPSNLTPHKNSFALNNSFNVPVSSRDQLVNPSDRNLTGGYSRLEDDSAYGSAGLEIENTGRVRGAKERMPSLTVTECSVPPQNLSPRSFTMDSHLIPRPLRTIKHFQTYVMGSIVFDEKVTHL